MKKIFGLMTILLSINSYASVSITNTNDDPAMYNISNVKLEALSNLHNLIEAINRAQTIQDDIQALSKLQNFASDPANAIINVNDTVTRMLNNFNIHSGTRFTNLQQLINSLAGSTSSTATLIKLNQASNTQLQNVSQILMQIEAEQQAIIKYRQAEIAEKEQQKRFDKITRQNIANNISKF